MVFVPLIPRLFPNPTLVATATTAFRPDGHVAKEDSIAVYCFTSGISGLALKTG
jgi:hypothetical protein